MKTLKRDGADGAVETVLAAMQYRRQRKDTHLLCIDGCASDADATTTKHWDNIHPDAVPINGDHGDMNCVRASISMMNSFYGGTLSQDRIAYFTEEVNTGAGNGIPEGDLAHRVGMSYSPADGGEETIALEWALDETTTFMDANPTFAQIQAWIDNNQPIMTRKPGHLRAMNGYRVEDDAVTQWVHIMDPWSGERWETYATWNGAAQGTWVGPVSALNARTDETGVSTDSDGDGIMDFDEQIRFATGRFDKDSDNDAVEDKNDLREYVFNAADAYSKRNADLDVDGVRKENDPDNDGDTFNDGCEDTNHNGKYEPASGETNNFAVDVAAACAAKPIHAIIVFDRSGSMMYPSSDPVFKYDRAAEAATLFLDTWLANDVPANTKTGLVFYDHSAGFDANVATNTTLELLTDAKRNAITAAFAVNRPNYGSTSIGGGLSKSMEAQGFNTAALPADNQNRMVIVLTDGMENTPPYMDDPAITAALSANKIDGYVLGIGDETQIDTVKLNNLADILNHTPTSLAKDLDAFELEKFFLQTLAETQGMEFSVDPVQVINMNEVRTHAIPVNNGAKRVSFVVAWNEPNGKLTFTLKNPLGVIVPADVTKSHKRYQVSTKRNPVPGLWTLTVTASAAATPTPAQITYSIMALEKNPAITSHFTIKTNDRITGTPLLITADLSRAKKAFTNALATVEVKQPRIGTGAFLSSASVLVPKELPVAEKEAKLTGTDKKRMVLAQNRMTVPMVSSTMVLNDKGIDGDEIAGDGRYSAYFRDTTRDGIYTFRLIASDALPKTKNTFNREKVISIPIHAAVHPQSTGIRIKARDFKPEMKETTVKIVVTPRDRFGNMVGPGYAAQIGFDVKGKVVSIHDLSDGSYEVEMIIPGDYRKDISVLPVRHIEKNKGNVRADK